MRRKWILTVLVFLALGAIVNVGVAWWFASQPETTSPPKKSGPYGLFWSFDVPKNLSENVFISPGYVDINAFRDTDHIERFAGGDPERNEWLAHLPKSSRLVVSNSEVQRIMNGSIDVLLTERIAGWPYFSLSGFELTSGIGPKPAMALGSGRIRIIPRSWQSANAPDWIPCQPVWSGFAADTALYGVGLWLVTLGPFQVRRGVRNWLRRRGGRCLKCGYDLRGQRESDCCPECGHPAPRAYASLSARAKCFQS